MVFVNSKLGNAFRIKVIDSTQDQEHYFGGAKKEVSLVIQGRSGSLSLIEGNNFALTGSTTLLLSWSLTDSQNAPIDSGSFSIGNFNVAPEDSITKEDAKFFCKVSASDATFSTADFTFKFKDKNSTGWSSFTDVSEASSFEVPDTDGFRKLSFTFKSATQGNTIISLNSASVDSFFQIVNSSNIYVYKNIGVEYSQPLTDDGVEFYKNLDNQNIIFSNVNRNIMGKVE